LKSSDSDSKAYLAKNKLLKATRQASVDRKAKKAWDCILAKRRTKMETTTAPLKDEHEQKKLRKLQPRENSEMVSQREIELVPPVPISARKCTDCLFLIIFILYCIGMLVIGIIGFQNGDPERLVYGSDYKGRTCGAGNQTGSKYIVYPRPQEDVFLAGTDVAVNRPWDINFFSVCTTECPRADEVVCDDDGTVLVNEAIAISGNSFTDEAMNCIDGIVPNPLTCYDAQIRRHCWQTLFDTTPVLFRCFPQYIFEVEKLPESGCTKYTYQTNSVTNTTVATCVKYREVTKRTTEEPTANDILFDSFNTVTQVFQRNVADVVKAWPVILISGLGVAALVGLIYIISLWLFVRLVVWGSVLGVQIMSIIFTIYLYIKAGIIQVTFLSDATSSLNTKLTDLGNEVSSVTGISLLNATTPNISAPIEQVTTGAGLPLKLQASLNYQQEFTSAAYFMTAITVMLFFLILLLQRRISRAIEIFQEASHAIRSTPCLVLIPFFSVPALLCLVAWWTASTAFIASSGEYTIRQINYTVPVDPADGAFEVKKLGTFSYVEVFIAYNFLGFLWISNFITAIVVFIIAGTVGHWYWKGNESDEGGYGAHPLFRSIYITLRFHLGTAAFGALMVAIVQFIRYFAAYLENRSKAVTKRSRLMKAVMCCVHCLLKCLEYCIKFISRNAFIISALYGESFCTSTRQAFYTITANITQVALVTFLGDLILRFGQILITLIASFSCWVYLDNRPEYDFGGALELNTFWFPTFLAGALGWFVANECLSIYDITVDTLLISFCQDQKLKKHMETKHKTLKSSKSMADFIKKAKHAGEEGTNNRRNSVGVE